MGEGSRLQLGDVGNNGTQEKKIIRKKTGNQNWQSHGRAHLKEAWDRGITSAGSPTNAEAN